MVGPCAICGQWRNSYIAAGDFTVKVYTYEKITPYNYRVTSEPATAHCKECWDKQMRGLVQQLEKMTSGSRGGKTGGLS
jgi:hypothetical protein